jgi:Retrotransposon gag protein
MVVVLTDQIKTDYDQLIAAFKRSYFKQPETSWALAKSLWSETPAPNETVLDFVSRIKKLAHQLKEDDEQINHAVLAGLQPHLRLAVLKT